MGNPNVNDIIRKKQSPTRLKGVLEDLVDMHCLTKTQWGNQHRYRITKKGCLLLGRYEAGIAEDSINRMIGLGHSELLKSFRPTMLCLYHLAKIEWNLTHNSLVINPESKLARELLLSFHKEFGDWLQKIGDEYFHSHYSHPSETEKWKLPKALAKFQAV